MRPLTSNEKLTLALVAFCLLSVAVSWPKRVAAWNGHTIEEWLKRWEATATAFEQGRGNPDGVEALLKQREEAEDAFYAMGYSMVPRLIAVVEAQDSPTRAKLEKWSESAGWVAHPFALEAPPKRAAFKGLAVLGSQAAGALPALSNALFQPDPPWEVVEALVGIGRPSLPLLLAGFTNSEARVRSMALSGLIGLGTNAISADSELRRLLSHPDSKIRGRALTAIAAIQPVNENPFPFLLSFRHDLDSEIRMGAMSGLAVAARMRGPESPGMAEAAAAFAELADDNIVRDTRRRAAWGLQHFKVAASPHIPVLLRLLKDSDAHIRTGAAHTLAFLKLRLPEAIPALAEALADGDANVREEVAAGLREMSAEVEKLQPGLIGSLGDLGKARYEQKRAWAVAYERSEAKRIERLKAKPEAKK